MQELPERSEFDGWRLVPQWGAEFKGVRGSRRACVGWVATHIETGHRIEFKPDVGGEPQQLHGPRHGVYAAHDIAGPERPVRPGEPTSIVARQGDAHVAPVRLHRSDAYRVIDKA